MTRTLPGIRVILSLVALLGAPLLGCSDSEDEIPTLPPPPAPTFESVAVEFDVTTPAATPCDATVAIIGNDEALGNWKLPGLTLTRDADGHFRGSAVLPVRKTISYNILLSSSGAQEVDTIGRILDVRSFTVADREGIEVKPTVTRWSLAGNAARPPVHFSVEVPANTPANAEIWLSGNQPALGEWNGAGVKLEKGSSGSRYFTCIPFATGTNLEFKVTRGSWDSVEKDAQGGEIDNHLHAVSAPARISVQVGSWRDLGPVEEQPDTLTGNIQYHDVDGASVGLRNRQLIVWLPPGYDTQTTRRYSVLYMHDGQNLMNARTAFGNVEWGVDETAQRLVEAGQVEPMIIVGVYNTQDRIAEYTQVPTTQYPDAGRADAYGRLLVEVVKPLIDSTYRTMPEAEHTGVAGSSLGGLVSMYFGLTHSSTFTRLGVVSPSVWWANRDIVTRVESLSGKLPLRIWADIGTNEDTSVGDSQIAVNDTRLLRDALIAEGWALDSDLKYLEVEGGRHNEAAWAARAEQILRYLYPPAP
ncbi:alpha/beta hydrolase-fold protein [Hyalangium rubrum]